MSSASLIDGRVVSTCCSPFPVTVHQPRPHILQVLSNLSETAEKGFLGSFKGAAGSWDKVIKAYEYNLIYLAEAAQTLSRNADYEIPFFKKQVLFLLYGIFPGSVLSGLCVAVLIAPLLLLLLCTAAVRFQAAASIATQLQVGGLVVDTPPQHNPHTTGGQVPAAAG